ncbi:NADH-quinone oxidoreductase subunit C [Ancylomarina sp. 16SWW S1-10-2]|uniref:hydrogenase large subunit n=1 Tax=Ancylomarina sp. 16SWW S1-10-2 TaxID=2499681 RepID=UPI00189FC2B7|nr:NADH-quinone oxidoreductase subunit C [Ancylomarina sp. 16SWW S1-10-2]
MIELENISRIRNNQSIDLNKITALSYHAFFDLSIKLFEQESKHCLTYFAYKKDKGLQFIMAVADDENHDIILLSHFLKSSEKQELKSLSETIFALHIFESEIHENFGVDFLNHPWLKPVRFAHNRANKKSQISNYPFYAIQSEELHEVGVGPIHAGIIEPGHFRFICNGENVLHLEIQFGWQHRGVEQLFLDKKHNLQRNILAENIAGDTVIGHTSTFVQTMEALADKQVSEQTQIERALALELERIAIHTGDIGALCTDAAYHLGSNVFAILRTLIINFTQFWCGNRFGKSLIRLGGTHLPFTEEFKKELLEVLLKFEKQFNEMAYVTYHLPSIQNRFDFVGTVSQKQARLIGTVGVSARMSQIERDIRVSHPNFAYQKYPYKTITAEKGDVFARFLLKKKEIARSIAWIRNLMDNYQFEASKTEKPNYNLTLQTNKLAISINEAWRGEVCHCAITNEEGNLEHYKITDPSLHNWKALELSLRNVEISDFPINNKSYNLSYCGHDL